MPRASQLQSLRESLSLIFDSLYLTKQIDRPTRLQLNRIVKDSHLISHLATHLYGPQREVVIPGEPHGRKSDLVVFQRENPSSSKKRAIRCFVGHRFIKPINESFRWNLRQLCELFGIEEEYSGFDGAAVNIINDICDKIQSHDFCLFDNRETTNPSKPNVYIEAGMAFALRRPFIFCHYKKEVWPADFSNVVYIPYRNYKQLFQELAAVLPIFLVNKVMR